VLQNLGRRRITQVYVGRTAKETTEKASAIAPLHLASSESAVAQLADDEFESEIVQRFAVTGKAGHYI
jgi:hypothetical protein